MRCKCGKEVGIRLMCEECTQKLSQEFIDIAERLRKSTERFDNAIKKLNLGE